MTFIDNSYGTGTFIAKEEDEKSISFKNINFYGASSDLQLSLNKYVETNPDCLTPFTE